MAAIAEWPDRIKYIFGTPEYPENGLFSFYFFQKGISHKVTIDDRLPVMQWGKSLLPINIRKSPNGAWWGPIMEKAAAKFYGRYENMDAGFQVESLYALTGMPTFQLNHDKTTDSHLWSLISNFDRNDYIMTTSVIKTDKI